MTTPRRPREPGPSVPTLAQEPTALLAHASVTPALQSALKMARAGPLAVAIQLPPASAEGAAQRLLERYPLALADHRIRSVARRLDVPTVAAQIMPPRAGQVAVLLFANVVPDRAEDWQPATGLRPLTWHLYEVATAAQVEADMLAFRPPRRADHHHPDALTWRLSRAARENYRAIITRTVMSATVSAASRGRRGGNRPNQTRTLAGAAGQLERLGEHLTRLPGLGGIRADVWALQAHMGRLWNQHHPAAPVPAWPRHPYAAQRRALLRPLADLLAAGEAQP